MVAVRVAVVRLLLALLAAPRLLIPSRVRRRVAWRAFPEQIDGTRDLIDLHFRLAGTIRLRF